MREKNAQIVRLAELLHFASAPRRIVLNGDLNGVRFNRPSNGRVHCIALAADRWLRYAEFGAPACALAAQPPSALTDPGHSTEDIAVRRAESLRVGG